MKYRTFALVGLTSLFALGANAAPAKKPTAWEKEPDSFMGLRFDRKVDSALPACPPRTVVSKQMCYEPPYTNLFTVRGAPEIGFGYSLSVFAGGSGVESFYLTTNSDNFQSLATLFTTKYGSPTDRTTEEVKTKAGATFTNETVFWRGKKVTISVQKYAGDINTTAATINDIAAVEKKAAEREAKSAASANKL